MHDGAAHRGAVSMWETGLQTIAANHMFIGSVYPCIRGPSDDRADPVAKDVPTWPTTN
jgi:hypothetical protein